MKSYAAFVGKEFTELLRTYKLLIMGAVFLVFGMMNPLTAKFTPELINSLMPQGMQMTVAAPQALDSYLQFFKNISQIGTFVLVIVFSGMLAGEYAKGTLVNMLTKGLKRRTVILAKFTVSALVWTACYVLCIGVTYIYTVYLFPQGHVSNLLFAVFCLWLFGLLLLASNLLGGTLFKSSYGCLLFTGAMVGVLLLINIIPQVQKYNPLALASNSVMLLTNDIAVSDFTAPIIISLGAIVLFLTSAILLFNKKQL